jgi:hypothetical protein
MPKWSKGRERRSRDVGVKGRGDNNVAILTLAKLAKALDVTVAKVLQKARL